MNKIPSNILTIDIGTSSVRAMLFDSNAHPIPGALAQVRTEIQTTGDGGAEFAADPLFATFVESVDQALKTVPNLPIAAVAMDTFVGNLLGVAEDGTPITPVITYADTRNAQDANSLRNEFGEEGCRIAHDRTGTLIHAAYWPARFRWITRTHPEWMQKVHHWVTLGDWIYFKLFGRWGCSYSVASWEGMLDRRKLVWDEPFGLRIAAGVHSGRGLQNGDSNANIISNLFSPLVDVDQTYINLRPEWASRWPQLATIPWLPAIGDGAAANLGSGCVDSSHVALTIGTTGAMRVVRNEEMASKTDKSTNPQSVPDGLWLYRVDRNRGLLGGATSEGGNLYGWLMDTLKLPPADELEVELAKAQPAAHGLTLLPFIAGERAPGWRADARASLINFTQHTKPIDIMQAAVEGIAYRLAIIHERLLPSLPTDHQIIASGGALLSSPAWMQIMADVLGRPVTALLEKEITARGVAVLALETLGLAERKLEIETGKTYLPNAERHQLHVVARQQQEKYYKAILAE
ncbi:MAG: gluconokinase [Caldilineaceae bacterium]